MRSWTLAVLVPMAFSACTPPQEPQLVATSSTEPMTQSRRDDSRGEADQALVQTPMTPAEAPQPAVDEPAARLPAQLEVQNIDAFTWTVLAGENLCIETSSLQRSCVEVGDSLYPGTDSMFLDVYVQLKSLADESVSIQAHQLIATLDGRQLRYPVARAIERNMVDLPALGKGSLHAEYEVPVEVLNAATFAIDIGAGDPLEFTFASPAAASSAKKAAQDEAAQQMAEDRLQEAEREAVRTKCWSLNDSTSSVATAEDFQWYIDSCSHLFDVGTFETYQRTHRSRF